MIKNYKDLDIWKKAMDLVVEVYKATKKLPDTEKFGLIGQMRKASISVPSNIAEGHGRSGKQEFLHFLSIAHGSLMELETQVLICQRLDYLKMEDVDPMTTLINDLSNMIKALIRKLMKP